MLDDVFYTAQPGHFPFVQANAVIANALEACQVVRNEDDGSLIALELHHFLRALLLKVSITDGKHFVNKQNFGRRVSDY